MAGKNAAGEAGLGRTAGPAPRRDAWRILGPGGGGTMIAPTISPHDPDLVVEHCDMTGAYITTDGGRSWRMFNLRGVVSAFAFDAQNPKVIYAGNMALWRSEDRGKTWRMLLPDPAANTVEHSFGDHAESLFTSDDSRIPDSRIAIQALAVHPQDSNRLYLVLGQPTPALFVSGDRGATWSLERDFEGEHILAVHPGVEGASHSTWILAAGGIYVGSDGRWERRSGPSDGDIQYAALGRQAESGGTQIYALVGRGGDIEPYSVDAYVSGDGGRTWEQVTARIADCLPRQQSGSAYLLRAVACCEADPSTAYVGFCRFGKDGSVQSSASGVVSTGIANSGIVKTADGGQNWEIVFHEQGRAADNLQVSWIEGRGPDQSIWFDAPVSLGAAPTDADVCYGTDLFRTYRTLDGGKTWETVNSVSVGNDRWTTRGLDVTTCYGVHFDPFDTSRIFISYTDIGLFRSEDGGKSWIGSTDGIPDAWRNTTYWIEFDPDHQGLIWGVFSGVHDLPRPKMWRQGIHHYRGGVAVSRDGGRTWEVSSQGMEETAPTHILLDPSSPVGMRTLYASAFGRGVYKSTDNGSNWSPRNTGIEGEEPFAWRFTRADDGTLYLIVARRSDDGSIGTPQDGALYRSQDGAETWKRVKLPEGVNGPNGIAVDPTDHARLYLAAWGRQQYPDDCAGGVFLSLDAGRTWRQTLNMSAHVYDVTVDPRDPNVVYACGFNSAAYRSADRGETWERIKGFNFKWGHRVVPDPLHPGNIYITTFGGSCWYGPALGDPSSPEDIATPVWRAGPPAQ
jgi:photosystem II stability/assembly factor-like uncharacterized protein